LTKYKSNWELPSCTGPSTYLKSSDEGPPDKVVFIHIDIDRLSQETWLSQTNTSTLIPQKAIVLSSLKQWEESTLHDLSLLLQWT